MSVTQKSCMENATTRVGYANCSSRSTPTAKRTPNIRYLALGFAIFMDHIARKLKPEPTNSRSATRCRVATSYEAFLPQQRRCLCPSSASPRSGYAQAQRPCSSSWEICVLWATTSEFAVANNETFQQASAHACSSGWNRGHPMPPPSLNYPVFADPP
jgi:hypothetical protein